MRTHTVMIEDRRYTVCEEANGFGGFIPKSVECDGERYERRGVAGKVTYHKGQREEVRDIGDLKVRDPGVYRLLFPFSH